MTATARGGEGTDQDETVWLVATAAALLALGCLLVAAGAVSSAVFGAGLAWPHRAELATIVGRTLADLGRPAAARPPALRSRPPGPVPYLGRPSPLGLKPDLSRHH